MAQYQLNDGARQRTHEDVRPRSKDIIFRHLDQIASVTRQATTTSRSAPTSTASSGRRRRGIESAGDLARLDGGAPRALLRRRRREAAQRQRPAGAPRRLGSHDVMAVRGILRRCVRSSIGPGDLLSPRRCVTSWASMRASSLSYWWSNGRLEGFRSLACRDRARSARHALRRCCVGPRNYRAGARPHRARSALIAAESEVPTTRRTARSAA